MPEDAVTCTHLTDDNVKMRFSSSSANPCGLKDSKPKYLAVMVALTSRYKVPRFHVSYLLITT